VALIVADMKIRNATSSDFPAVEKLLLASKLPVEGVRDNFSTYIVADEEGAIAGAIGFEKYGPAALLRSAVVSPANRGTGVGRRLVERLLQRATEEGIDDLYLLTTTAENYFPKFGFAPTTRSAVPESVKASAEFRGACPETAVVMSRRARGGTRQKD
jgi:N-acetylglutamate synthase-like GNAT family acetyltransferase